MNKITFCSLLLGTSFFQLANPDLETYKYKQTTPNPVVETSLQNIKNSTYQNGYEESYQIEELLNNYTYPEIEITNHQNKDLYDPKTDSIKWDKLYSTIQENNREFLKTTEEDYYEEISELELREIIAVCIYFLNQKCEEKNLDKKEIACKLEELKILKEKRTPYIDIMFTGELDWHNFKLALTEESDKDYFKIKIAHEIAHLIQAPCPDMQKETIKVSVWQEPIEVFDTNQPTSLRTRVVDESVAYIIAQDYHSSYPIDFPDMTNFNLLQFVMLPKEDFQVNQTIIDLSLTKDQEGFYQLFNADQIEEKQQVHEIMHTMDTLDFYDQSLYFQYPESKEKLTEIYTINALNLSKYLMANILEREEPLPENTAFYLLKLYKEYILYTLDFYSDEEKDNENSKELFLENYSQLEENMYPALAEIYQDENIKANYNQYEYEDEDVEGFLFKDFVFSIKNEIEEYNQYKKLLKSQ